MIVVGGSFGNFGVKVAFCLNMKNLPSRIPAFVAGLYDMAGLHYVANIKKFVVYVANRKKFVVCFWFAVLS